MYAQPDFFIEGHITVYVQPSLACRILLLKHISSLASTQPLAAPSPAAASRTQEAAGPGPEKCHTSTPVYAPTTVAAEKPLNPKHFLRSLQSNELKLRQPLPALPQAAQDQVHDNDNGSDVEREGLQRGQRVARCRIASLVVSDVALQKRGDVEINTRAPIAFETELFAGRAVHRVHTA
ncbi:hypothetical protein PR003_g6588 [Phytophthora rubi]|uniref:Uncharacterized protein n=1 Tax=Phytophthora rubi TaxID=129364 RepID=A0A6A3KBC9_9STRA|nr:hypothetical protein PR002_g17239 [Phytophthora rubi]KAE9042283.1 hypothetical protein PR001_g6268 [Phytophthora rubi]KAE9348124.1 hypothetical protein PR003_g6588 [Phytophthora rubi]